MCDLAHPGESKSRARETHSLAQRSSVRTTASTDTKPSRKHMHGLKRRVHASYTHQVCFIHVWKRDRGKGLCIISDYPPYTAGPGQRRKENRQDEKRSESSIHMRNGGGTGKPKIH